MKKNGSFSNIIFVITAMLLMITSGCRKIVNHLPLADPFKAVALPVLTEKIPYQALGSGKIVFNRLDDFEQETGFYVIDINKKRTYGFTLHSGIREPNISPDGTKIACSLLNNSDWRNMWNIHIMNIDGSVCFPVYKSDYRQYYPTWTPDGAKIICYDNEKLYMLSPNENSSDREELTKFSYGDANWYIMPSGGFSFSYEGKFICVSTGGPETNGLLQIIPYLGKSGVSTLVNQHISATAFSPDGLKIAFASLETDSLGNPVQIIKSINPDGTNLVTLLSIRTYTPSIGYLGYSNPVALCWSPDGKKILFSAIFEQNGGYNLFVMNADGTGLTRVTDNINSWDFDVSWGR